MPLSAQSASSGKSRRAGQPTRRTAASAPSASAATPRRSTDRCAQPSARTASRIAAKAEAHSTTVVASAAGATRRFMRWTVARTRRYVHLRIPTLTVS